MKLTDRSRDYASAFADGVAYITNQSALRRQNSQLTYVNGTCPCSPSRIGANADQFVSVADRCCLGLDLPQAAPSGTTLPSKRLAGLALCGLPIAPRSHSRAWRLQCEWLGDDSRVTIGSSAAKFSRHP
jgi:hypothetical protein